MSAHAFKAEDLAEADKLRALLEEITADPTLVDRLPEDQLMRVEKLISPYGNVPESAAKATASEDEPHVCLSFTNLRQEYIKKLITTSIVGYLYRRCDEYGRQFSDTVDHMDDMKAAESRLIAGQARLVELEREIITAIRERNDLDAIIARDTPIEAANREKYYAERARMTRDEIHAMRDFASTIVKAIDDRRLLNKKITALEAEREAIQGLGKRFIIRSFLDDQFRFNPDKHVRSSYVAQSKSSGTTDYTSKFVPPDDFFHNFQYYMDSNYEELRSVSEHLYRMKPDLDVGIIPYGEYKSAAEADKFIERNKSATIASILALKIGKWNFLESFKANRDRIDAYRGTIVEDILQQVKSDTKLGAELVKKRVTDKAATQAREFGPPPKQIGDYKEAKVATETTGVVSSNLSEEEQKRLYTEHQERKTADEAALLAAAAREDPAPHDTIRVNVYKFSAGGAETQKSHFLTEAVPPDANAPSHHIYM